MSDEREGHGHHTSHGMGEGLIFTVIMAVVFVVVALLHAVVWGAIKKDLDE